MKATYTHISTRTRIHVRERMALNSILIKGNPLLCMYGYFVKFVAHENVYTLYVTNVGPNWLDAILSMFHVRKFMCVLYCCLNFLH